MLKPLVIAAEAGRQAVRIAQKIPGADVAIAKGIIASARAVPSSTDVEMTGKDTILRRFHSQVANTLFETNARGARRALAQLEIGQIDDPDLLERMAVRYIRLREFEAALAMRRRAVDLDPENPGRYLALARSLQRANNSSVVRDAVAGLTAGPEPLPEEARRALDKATELAPDNPAILHQRGRLEFDHGDTDEGIRLLEEAVARRPSPGWYTDLALRYRRPHVLQLDKALDNYEKALRKRPNNPQTFRHIITMGCRTEHDWPRMWANAEIYENARGSRGSRARRAQLANELVDLFRGGPISAERAETALAVMETYETDRGIRLSWPTTALIVYRLQFAGHLGAGFQLRRRLAERTLDWLGHTSAGHIGHRQMLLSALVYLERFTEAQELIDPMPWEPQTPLASQQLEKLAADTHLVQGRPDRYVEYSRRARTRTPLPADTKMEELVRGKRVAIVGPVDTGDRLGSVIDEYDVVVRPRFAPDFIAQHTESQGSRTDIVYINAQDIDQIIEPMGQAIGAGTLKLAVARPLSIQHHLHRRLDWLRFYRQDFSLCFHGASLGIQRFIYDIMQFQPAEIAVFNSDMYTGLDPFAAGYRDAKDVGFGPGSIMNDLIVLHDLLFDFKYLGWLHQAGVVTLHGKSAEVGALTPEQYVEAIESGGALR